MTTSSDSKQIVSPPWFVERRNIAIIITLIFIVIFVGASYLSYEHHQSARERALKEDRATANLVSLVLEGYLQRNIKTMESYTNRPLLLQAVRNKNAARAREHLINLRKTNPNIESVFITDRQGTLWANDPAFSEVIGKNFAYRNWYQGVSKDWKPYVSDVFLRIVGEKDQAVSIAMPFFDEKGEALGILANAERTVELSKIIQRITVDPGTYIHVTDRKGNLVYSSRFGYEKEMTPFPFYSVINKMKDVKHQSVAVPDPFEGGRKRYISYAPAAGMGWGVFVGRGSRSILLSELTYYIQITAISILLFLMILLALVFFRQRVIRQQLTDQLQAERELQASEERYRNLFDNISSGVAVYAAKDNGEDFIILNLNEAGQKITRVYADYIGKSVCDVFPGVRELGLFQVFQQVWKTGEAEYYPASLYKDDVLTFWAENWVYKLPSGEVVAVFDDITERKRAEEELRRQSRLLASINRILQETLTEASEEAVFQACLTVAQEITGSKFGFIGEITPEGRFTTKALSDPGWETCRIPGTQAALMIDNMIIRGIWGEVILQEHSLIVNEPLSFPGRVGIPEGHPQLVSFLGVPLKDQHKVVGMIAMANNEAGYTQEQLKDLETIAVVFMEAIRRKQGEMEIHRLNAELDRRVLERTAQLEAANQELEAFSYSVSHDLRAPLRGIDGFSQALLEDYQDKLDETGRNYLKRVRTATERMDILIDDMLKLARVTRAEFKLAAVDLSGMVRTIAKTFQQNNPERTVVVMVDEDIVIRCDPYLMQIAMTNLIDNAWKFTGKNTQGRIEFGKSVKDGKVIYFVRDNGVGFDMTYANKLFGAFQRLHTTEEFPGTGIGLATVKRIIKQHGGHIWAEGEVGKGTTCYFTLPSVE